MISLKDQLFPDSNITGKTDRNNQPILVGQRLRDENDEVWNVIMQDDGTYGVEHAEVQFSFIRLNDFIIMSQWVEVVVQAPGQDKAAVAMAPFDKEHNSPLSWLDEMGTLPKQNKYKSVSTSKTKRLP